VKNARGTLGRHEASDERVGYRLLGGGPEEVEELADLSPGGVVDVTRLSLPDGMLELGEDLFDGIEVGL
jgi:hypothetical protein